MAVLEVKVPQLSESVTEATLLQWHKKAGEAVALDENLVDIETDKVVLELPSPGAGVLVSVLKGDGATVVALFNRSDDRRSCLLDEECRGRELWSGEERELCGELTVQPHSVQLYRTLSAPRRQEPVFRDVVRNQSLQGAGNFSAGTF